MYKVLIIDDEPFIREGISKLIKWENINTKLIGTAGSAEEAVEIIHEKTPDIVIADINMPGKSGIDLIEELYEVYPDMRFIVISGYSEFEYAHRLMKCGVNHYLLKPSDEEEIEEAITDIIREFENNKSKENIKEDIETYLSEVTPYLKTNLLKDYILTGVLLERDWKYIDSFENLRSNKYIMIVFELGENIDFLEKYGLKNVAEEIVCSKIQICDFFENVMLILVTESEIDEVFSYVKEITEQFEMIFGKKITAAISNVADFADLSKVFINLKRCFGYKFYLGEECIITEDMMKEHADFFDMEEYVEKIVTAVRAGTVKNFENIVDEFVEKLKVTKIEISKVNIYFTKLMIEIILNSDLKDISSYSENIIKIQTMDRLDEIADEIKMVIKQIADKNHTLISEKYSDLVNSLIVLIHENLANEEFSLSWVAKQKLYVNVDYLGKIFLKETGEKFSRYVMRLRMEKAKKMIAENKYKIYEVAKATGFAEDGHYFGICFKKYTGKSPSEYLAEVTEGK